MYGSLKHLIWLWGILKLGHLKLYNCEWNMSFPQKLVVGAFLKILPSGHSWKDILDFGPNFENFIILKNFGHAGQEIKFKGLLSLWMILGFQALISKRTISWRRFLIFCDQWKCNWALRPKVFLFLFSFFFFWWKLLSLGKPKIWLYEKKTLGLGA